METLLWTQTNMLDIDDFSDFNRLILFSQKSSGHIGKETTSTPVKYSIMSFISSSSFNLWAIKLFTNQEISWALDPPSQLSLQRFRSLFLLTPREWCTIVSAWKVICHSTGLNTYFGHCSTWRSILHGTKWPLLLALLRRHFASGLTLWLST
jgi:hypothetical protein